MGKNPWIVMLFMAISVSIGNRGNVDSDGDQMISQNQDCDLPECKGVRVSIDRAFGIYSTSDTVVLVIENLTVDSALVSAGLEGKSSRWEPVVHDAFGFANGGDQMSDDVSTKIIKPLDSVRVGVPLSRLRSVQRKYKKWHFYVYELSFPPIMDFKCHMESSSFVVR